MKMLRNQKGFTLIESLMTLLCIGVFFTVPLMALKNWQKNVEIEYFFNQLERNIQRTHQSAIVDSKTTQILQDGNNNRLLFQYSQHWKNHVVVLPLPDDLKLKSINSIEFLNVTGNLKAINKIVIEDNANKRKVEYSFQLGSGKVIRSEKKL